VRRSLSAPPGKPDLSAAGTGKRPKEGVIRAINGLKLAGPLIWCWPQIADPRYRENKAAANFGRPPTRVESANYRSRRYLPNQWFAPGEQSLLADLQQQRYPGV
jgi:hypothetical protein